jgi:hypothetical protein
MKKQDIPQDESGLKNFTKEVVYAVDDAGNYTAELSKGWEVKSTALNVAWTDIEQRIADAKQQVLKNEASPILYFLELRLMDMGIVSAYTGFWKWTIKQHLKPAVFKKLSENKLKKYAEAFNITVEELKTMRVHGE